MRRPLRIERSGAGAGVRVAATFLQEGSALDSTRQQWLFYVQWASYTFPMARHAPAFPTPSRLQRPAGWYLLRREWRDDAALGIRPLPHTALLQEDAGAH